MALNQTHNVTSSFNANGFYVQDLSNWDYAIVQLVSPATAVSFTASNDSGAIAGVSDGNVVSAANFTTAQGTKLADGTGVTSLNASGLVKFNQVGHYLKLSGTTATEVIIELSKIF